MIGQLLTIIGLPTLVRVLAGSLKDLNHPAAKGAANALGDLDRVLTQGHISPEQRRLAHNHIEKMAQTESKHLEVAMQEVNTSLRAEILSNDKYVRRMRPTFGYLMAFTWTSQMVALAYVIVFKTEKASLILEAMGSLGTIWAVGLSVLGIYVYKRSEDKKLSLSDPLTAKLTQMLQTSLEENKKKPPPYDGLNS